MAKSVNGAPSFSVYYFRCSYTMDHESKFSFSRGNTQQVVLIIPAPVTAISQPIKLNDGAEAGRIRHNRYLLGCVCMQTRVRERASCIMPTPPPLLLTCSMWQSQGKPPRAKYMPARICSSLYNTHSCLLPLYASRNLCSSFYLTRTLYENTFGHLSDTPDWIVHPSHLSCTPTQTVCHFVRVISRLACLIVSF